MINKQNGEKNSESDSVDVKKMFAKIEKENV